MRSAIVLVATFLLLSPFVGHAHGTGNSFEAQVEGGFIDVGYEPAEFEAGEKIALEFDIHNVPLPKGERIDFDRVWVRLRNGETGYFAAGIGKSPYGPTTLSMTLPSEARGLMTMQVRFEKAGVPIAEGEFSAPVVMAKNESHYRENLSAGAAGLLLGIGIMFAYYAAKKRSP